MAVESFDQLEVWQKAHALTLEVYRETQKLPEEEEFGLILRMRAAAMQVPANIANGFERRMPEAKLHLYREARASVEELRYYFILCRDLGYPITFDSLATQGEALARMVGGLCRSIAQRDRGDGGRRRGGGGGGRGRGGDRGGRRDSREPHEPREESHEPIEEIREAPAEGDVEPNA